MTSATTTRRPRPSVPPSQHARRRRVRPGRAPRGPGRVRLRGRVSRRGALAALAGTLVVVLLLGWVAWFSPVLAVRTVTVIGAQGATATVVRDLAAVPDGQPLLRVDLARIEAALAAVPQLASVSVTRDWPSTVRIAVVERVGLAVADLGGTRWLVDREGVLFAQVTQPPTGLPSLQVEAPGPDDRATRAALEVIDALPVDIREQVTVVAAQSADSVVLTLAGGRTVIWGSAADSERKALVLAGVFARPARTIDVSSPSTVVLR